MTELDSQDIQQRAARIRLLVLDVDGVLTDGSIVYTDAGEQIKSFHVRDGHGLRLLQQQPRQPAPHAAHGEVVDDADQETRSTSHAFDDRPCHFGVLLHDSAQIAAGDAPEDGIGQCDGGRRVAAAVERRDVVEGVAGVEKL